MLQDLRPCDDLVSGQCCSSRDTPVYCLLLESFDNNRFSDGDMEKYVTEGLDKHIEKLNIFFSHLP